MCNIVLGIYNNAFLSCTYKQKNKNINNNNGKMLMLIQNI